MENNNNYYQWQPPQKPQKPFNGKKLGTIVLVAALAVLVLVGTLTCFYTVDDKQQAVVTTFGKVTDVVDAGMHFKLPFGIQNVQKVDVNVYQKIELGYRSDGVKDSYVTVDDESSMITGDYYWPCSHLRASPSFPSQLEWKIGLAWANTRGILNSPS